VETAKLVLRSHRSNIFLRLGDFLVVLEFWERRKFIGGKAVDFEK